MNSFSAEELEAIFGPTVRDYNSVDSTLDLNSFNLESDPFFSFNQSPDDNGPSTPVDSELPVAEVQGDKIKQIENRLNKFDAE